MAAEAIIYHNPKCSTSRKTLELLRDNGIEPKIVQYLKTPPSRDELVAMIRSFTLANTVYNQLNERREGEATMIVELRWRDLHTGELLSRPAARAVRTAGSIAFGSDALSRIMSTCAEMKLSICVNCLFRS